MPSPVSSTSRITPSRAERPVRSDSTTTRSPTLPCAIGWPPRFVDRYPTACARNGSGIKRAFLRPAEGLCQALSEAIAPTWEDQLPIQCTLGFGIGSPSNFVHHYDGSLAGNQPADENGNAKRRFRPHCFGKHWQPLRDRRRVVVNYVVDPRRPVVERPHSRCGDIVQMDERPDARAATDDGQSPAANQLHKVSAVARDRTSGTVEDAVTQREALKVSGLEQCRLQGADRVQTGAHRAARMG